MAKLRYSENASPLLRPQDPHGELLASLNRINLYNPPVQTCSTVWRFNGFYSGPTSIAFLFFRLDALYPDLLFKGQSLLDWCYAYLDVGQHIISHEVEPDHCGIANEHLAQLALKVAIEKDASLAKKICSYKDKLSTVEGTGSNEWLYGRTGYLYFLRLVKNVFDARNATRMLIDTTIGEVVQLVLSSPKPWIWGGKAYLGAAHGAIGIITQIVLSSGTGAQVEPALLQLLDKQFSTGNLPSSLLSQSDELVQFCHGSPGLVISLESIRDYFPGSQHKIDDALNSARNDVWKRGLLTKTPCLCHGIAGNALALDGDQFEHFLTYITTEELDKPGWLGRAEQSEEFAGLYVGEAGRAWLWALADKGIERTCIGYNDL